MESGDDVLKNIKLVDVKDLWMGRGVKTVNGDDDCSKLKEIFNGGDAGVLVSDISEFGDEELVGWITKEKFEEFIKTHETCQARDMINSDASFSRIAPASTILAAKLKLEKEKISALPIVTIHGSKEISMGYLSMKDIENIKKKYSK